MARKKVNYSPEALARRRAATKAFQKKYYATPEGKVKRLASQRRWKKSERGRLYNKEWARRKYRWEYHLMRTYGISPEQYEEMCVGGCKICGSAGGTKKRTRLHIDHDHDTGGVRDALCDHCNRGLGCFKDKIELLEKAIAYLKRHKGG